MNKEELVTAMADKTQSSKKAAEAMLNAFIETIGETLAKNDKISLVGFGTFETKERAAREGRNPRTGEPLHIEAKKTAVFTAGKGLKDKLG